MGGQLPAGFPRVHLGEFTVSSGALQEGAPPTHTPEITATRSRAGPECAAFRGTPETGVREERERVGGWISPSVLLNKEERMGVGRDGREEKGPCYVSTEKQGWRERKVLHMIQQSPSWAYIWTKL